MSVNEYQRRLSVTPGDTTDGITRGAWTVTLQALDTAHHAPINALMKRVMTAVVKDRVGVTNRTIATAVSVQSQNLSSCFTHACSQKHGASADENYL